MTEKVYPFHVMIYKTNKKKKQKKFVCGGTLIEMDIVVTAAHCIYDGDSGWNDPKNYHVRAGQVSVI